MPLRDFVARTGLWLSTLIVAGTVGMMPVGRHTVLARTSAPGHAAWADDMGPGTNRTAVDREAMAPAPSLARIRPCAAPSNRPARLSLVGSGFSRKAVVRWLGAKTNFDLPATFISSTRLSAAVSTSILTSSPNAGIVVINPHNRSSQERILVITSARASSCATGNSDRVAGTAIAVTGATSALGHGAGTLAVTPLQSDPVAPAPFRDRGQYLLLSIDLDSRFKSITLATRAVHPRDRLYWYNGTVWAAARGQRHKAGGRIVMTITANSSPSLHDLHHLASVSISVGLPTTG